MDSRSFGLIFSAFGLFGLMFGVWQVLLADLQQALQLSPVALGTGLTTGVLAAFPAMVLGGRVADRWGAQSLMAGTGILMGLALMGMAAVASYGLLIALLLVLFGASGAFDVAINTAAIHLEQGGRRRILAYCHAAFSGLAAVGALSAGILLFIGVPFRTLYILVALLIMGLAVVAVGLGSRLPHLAGRGSPAPHLESSSSLYQSPIILLIACLAALGLLAEGIMESWTAIYLRSTLDLPTVMGASGVTVFYLAMLLGRLLAAKALGRCSRQALLQMAGVVMACGMLLALATVYPPLILGGFLLVGLALAGVMPIAFSMAGDAAPRRAGEASSIITVLGYGGFMLGPVLIGGLAEWWGLRLALTTVSMVGGCIVLLGFLLRRAFSGIHSGGQ